MGMLLAVNVDKKPMLGMVERAIKHLFHNPSDAFYTGTVVDLLFDGIPVDCGSDDNTVKALCQTFKAEKAFRQVNDTHLSFSLFYGVSSSRFTVSDYQSFYA